MMPFTRVTLMCVECGLMPLIALALAFISPISVRSTTVHTDADFREAHTRCRLDHARENGQAFTLDLFRPNGTATFVPLRRSCHFG